MAKIQAIIDATGAKTGAAEVDRSVQRVTDATRKGTVGFKRMDDQMGKAASRAKLVAKAFIGLTGTVAGVAAIRRGISIMAEFGKTMSTVRGVTQANSEQFARLEATARELGASTAFSATEAGEGLLFLARAGFSVDEAIAASSATLNLAVAGALDLGSAADYASNIVAQFGLSAAETERVVDTLVKTSNSANTDVTQLAEAMKFAGPIAGALGVSLEETAAAVGVLGDSGIQASLAGTNLRAIMLGLLSPTTSAEEAIGRLGLTLDDVNPTANSLAEIFESLVDAGLDAASANEIFGRRAAAGALIISNSVSKMRSLTTANEEAAGSGREMAEVMADNLAGSFKSLVSASQEVVLAIGDQGVTGSLKSVIDTVTETIRMFGGIEGTVHRASEAAIFLKSAIQGLIITSVAFIGLRLVMYMYRLVTAIYAARTAVNTLTLAMAKNPIGLFAVALSTLVGTIYAFSTAVNSTRAPLRDMGEEVVTLSDQLETLDEQMGRLGSRATSQERITALQKELDILRELAVQVENEGARQQDIIEALGGQTIQSAASSFEDYTQQLSEALSGGRQRPESLVDAIREAESAQEQWKRETNETARALRALGQDKIVELIEQRIQSVSDELESVRQGALEELKKGMDEVGDSADRFKSIMESLNFELTLSGLSDGQRQIYQTMREAEAALNEQGIVDPYERGYRLAAVYELVTAIQRQKDAQEEANQADEEAARLVERRQSARTQLDQLMAQLQFESDVLGTTNEEREKAEFLRQAEAAAISLQTDEADLWISALEREYDAYLKSAEAIRKKKEEQEALRQEQEFAQNQLDQLLISLGRERRSLNAEFAEIQGRADQMLVEEAERLAKEAGKSPEEIARFLDQIKTELTRINELRDGLDDLKDLDDLFYNIGKSAASGFEDWVFQVKSLNEALEDTARQISRLVFRQFVTQPLAEGIGGFLSGFASAQGNVFMNRRVVPFASGGIVDSPITFPLRNGVGLAGEAGPEAIIPLKRDQQGNLGVRGGVNVTMNVYAKDANSFRKSSRQITQDLQRGLRNGVS